MSLDIEMSFNEKEKRWIFRPIGEIDIYTSPEFKSRVLEAFGTRESDILIDCTDLEYVDSTGLGVLIYILKELKEKKYKIYLENVKANIKKLLDITKLDKMFIIRGEINE